MTRIKGGDIAQKRRKKSRTVSSGFRGAHSKLTRIITQQIIRAFVSAHRDRDKKKRNFRRLWITRINAVIREGGIFYNYSKLIHDLYKKQLLFNRKILAQIAIFNRNCLYIIAIGIRKKMDCKEYNEIVYRLIFNLHNFKWSYPENELRESGVEITMRKYAKVVKINEHVQ
uniref:ribosomal protein L20 n=1 Tax=Cymbaria mongolica TaxID=374685 RepID=UPI00207B03F9|nr:ribosomal protein L20 [Cymbaria mongolica]URT60438.1 ribosomal protein L20 [Cymbaria mongolica]